MITAVVPLIPVDFASRETPTTFSIITPTRSRRPPAGTSYRTTAIFPSVMGLTPPARIQAYLASARRWLICADRTGERLPCRFSRLTNRDIRRADLDRGRNLKLPLQGYRCLSRWRIQEHRKRPVALPVCAGRRHAQRLAPQRSGAEQSDNSPNHEAFCSGSEATA